MGKLVLIDRPTEGVALVTLNRPEKQNALSKALLTELDQELLLLAEDQTLRALVLTGAGRAFCAGLDLGELTAGVAFTPASLNVLRNFPVPVIGAVNGAAITGGLELALACDFRIAGEHARFADTHSRVGVVPAWGLTARLPQAVGQSWARQMSFTGDFVDAQTALRIGLVNQVVPQETLVSTAVGIAESIASTNQVTLDRVREIYGLVRDGSGAAGLAAELETAGQTLAIDSPEEFAARRDAVFARARGQA